MTAHLRRTESRWGPARRYNLEGWPEGVGHGPCPVLTAGLALVAAPPDAKPVARNGIDELSVVAGPSARVCDDFTREAVRSQRTVEFEMLHVWLRAAVATGWAGDTGDLIDALTGPGGPVAPFVREGRSKVAASWPTEGGRSVAVSNVTQRSRLNRILSDPTKIARRVRGSVTLSVWEDGHPERDWRPDNVLISIQYGMDAVPAAFIEMWVPLEESTAIVASVEAWVRGWGARFGGGWAQMPDPDDPNRPGWHPYVASDNGMLSVLAMGLVDPVVLGPSWLMVFRPGTFHDGVIPAGLAQSPRVWTVPGIDGDYTMVTLADDATSVTQAETGQWLNALGPMMDPVLQDPTAALALRRAFAERHRTQGAE